MHDPSLTTAQFLCSPQLEDFCGQFGASTLAEVHRSLSNKSKIGACIQQARFFFYPEGQDLNGVVFLQNTNPLIKDYVQEYYHDSQGTMILCGFRDQIEVLSSQKIKRGKRNSRYSESNLPVEKIYLSDGKGAGFYRFVGTQYPTYSTIILDFLLRISRKSPHRVTDLRCSNPSCVIFFEVGWHE